MFEFIIVLFHGALIHIVSIYYWFILWCIYYILNVYLLNLFLSCFYSVLLASLRYIIKFIIELLWWSFWHHEYVYGWILLLRYSKYYELGFFNSMLNKKVLSLHELSSVFLVLFVINKLYFVVMCCYLCVHPCTNRLLFFFIHTQTVCCFDVLFVSLIPAQTVYCFLFLLYSVSQHKLYIVVFVFIWFILTQTVLLFCQSCTFVLFL